MRFHAGMISAALLLQCSVASSASAVWGLKYEVYDHATSSWTNKLTVNVYSGAADVQYRMSVWTDTKTKVNVYKNGKVLVSSAAVQPLRVQVSSRIANWGTAANGDQLVSYTSKVNSAGLDALKNSLSVKDTILGVNKSSASFFGNLKPKYTDYAVVTPSTVYFEGTIRIGNLTAAAKNRTIKLAANSLAAASPNSGNGGAYGASFYTMRKPTDIASGIVTTMAVNYYSLVTVVSTPPRPGSFLAGDGFAGTTDVPAPGSLGVLGIALLGIRRRR